MNPQSGIPSDLHEFRGRNRYKVLEKMMIHHFPPIVSFCEGCASTKNNVYDFGDAYLEVLNVGVDMENDDLNDMVWIDREIRDPPK